MTCPICGRDETLVDGVVCGFCKSRVREAMPVIDRFAVYRVEDESGVSSEGIVAVGVVMPSEKVAIEWLNDPNPSLDTDGNRWALYDSIGDARKEYSHLGKTKIVFFDGRDL